MMTIVEKFVNKFRLDRFFNSKLILAIDLLVSLSASICMLLFSRFLLWESALTPSFALSWCALSVGFSLLFFIWFRTYRTIVRHTTLKEFAKICVASFMKSLCVVLVMVALPFLDTYYAVLALMDMSLTIIFLLMVRVTMIVAYDTLREKVISSRKRVNVMVYGVDDKSVATVTRLANSPHYNVIGYLNFGRRLRGQNINGVKIAVVAFTKGVGGLGMPAGNEKCVNVLYKDYASSYQKVDEEGITAVLEAVNAQKPDITIALLHWGSEYNDIVSDTQNEIVELMQSLGVDAIVGTHPHYVQKIVFDQNAGTVIAYSLGDFYGTGDKNGTFYSVLLNLEVTRNNLTGETKITACSHTPVYLLTPERDGEPMRLLRMDAAIESFEGNHINAVTSQAYANLVQARSRANSRVEKGK